MKHVLELEHISKSYGRVRALSDVNLTLQHGVYALLGPNGSGKSTMMNIISGLLKPTEGTVLYGGSDIRRLGAEYRSRVGYMPQYPAMYPSFTVLEFLLYMSELKAIKKGAERAEIDYLLSRTELSEVADRRISALSGGMKQRLSLCSAVLGSPELLILDEPTAGLDPRQRVALRNFISEISADKTVLWATHIVSDVESIASEVIFVKKGVATAVSRDEREPMPLEAQYLAFFGDAL